MADGHSDDKWYDSLEKAIEAEADKKGSGKYKLDEIRVDVKQESPSHIQGWRVELRE